MQFESATCLRHCQKKEKGLKDLLRACLAEHGNGGLYCHYQRNRVVTGLSLNCSSPEKFNFR